MIAYKNIGATEIYILGLVNDDLDFNYGSALKVYGGCAVTLLGQLWYFGGAPQNYQQVSLKIIMTEVRTCMIGVTVDG